MATATPALHARSWLEVGALVVMWAVMMVAMMTPAAAPMILMFATVHRRRATQGRPSIPTVIFLFGYFVVCRSPLSFVMTRWREGRRGAFAMGLRHGLYCPAAGR